MSYLVGIDLGGTNISAVLVNPDGEIVQWLNLETQAEKGPKQVIERINHIIKTMLSGAKLTEKKLRGIGLGLPGIVHRKTQTAIFLPNLPGWHHINLTNEILPEAKIPLIIDNDVRMAAWGEKNLGAGVDIDDLVFVSLGTGIGSGIFIKGKLHRGYSESAGEIGHMIIAQDGLPCSCGSKGCLETYASARGIVLRTKLALEKYSNSFLHELISGEPSKLTAQMVGYAAEKGDHLAREIIEETALYLGLGLVNLVNLINPQRVILGGGVMGLGRMLLDPVKEVVLNRAMPLNREVEIVEAFLKEKAGALGAAEMARHETAKKII